jgi:hypothetical protein
MYESYFRGFIIPVPHLSTFNLPTFYQEMALAEFERLKGKQ